MLNSDDRRPAFDQFFAGLDSIERTVFMDAAMRQRDAIQDGEDDPVSVIDCMENVWDEITDAYRGNVAAYAIENN